MDKRNREQDKIDFSLRFSKALLLRGHSNKSLAELKELFGVSRTLIQGWRSEKTMPSIYTAGTISKILDISYEWLLTGVGTIEGFKMKTADEVALTEKYRNLTKQGKRKLMTFAFKECNDHDLAASTKAEQQVAKQVALKLVNDEN